MDTNYFWKLDPDPIENKKFRSFRDSKESRGRSKRRLGGSKGKPVVEYSEHRDEDPDPH
jgi:hypothetical protein